MKGFFASIMIAIFCLLAILPLPAAAQTGDVAFREWVRVTLAAIQTRTNTWEIASGPLTDLTNRLVQVEAGTSTWNTASTTAIAATGSIAAIQASTSTWNTASTTAIAATNSIAAIEAAFAAGSDTNYVIAADGTNYSVFVTDGLITNTTAAAAE